MKTIDKREMQKKKQKQTNKQTNKGRKEQGEQKL